MKYFKKLRHFYERHPGLKKILLNISWLSFDKFFRMGIGIFMSAWVARYLGPEKFGYLSYSLALIALVGIPSLLGLNQVVQRELVKYSDQKYKLLGTVFSLKFVAGGIMYGGLFVYTILAVDDQTSRTLFCILGLSMINNAFKTFDFWFQSQVLSKYTVWATNLSFIIVCLLRTGLILTKRSLIAFAWVTVIDMIISSSLLLSFYVKQSHDLNKWRFNCALAKSLLRQSWPLIFSSLAIMIYVKIDQVMLGKIVGMEKTGIYAAAVRISEVWYFIPLILASSFFPTIVRSKSLGEKVYQERLQYYYNLNVGLAYMLILASTFLAPWLVQLLYGQKYEGADTILMIHIWASLFVFLGVARAQWLINEGLVKFHMFATFLGAISNIVLNILLIPSFSGIGAAVATVISYALSGCISSFLYRETYKNGILQVYALSSPLIWIILKLRGKRN